VDENDIVNHPGDLRFVITTVLAAARRRTSLLSGLVNPGEIGVVGHSDGADVTLAVADSSCCRDPQVKAAAVLSGAELASFGGSYFAGPPVPLLVAQGSADIVNFPACSRQIYDEASTPKYYLDLLGAGHEPPYAGPQIDPAQRRAVARVTTDFFGAELLGERGGTAAMTIDGDTPGVARVTSGGSAPPAPGSCPGA
jgi:predicted dienelactone hydrolase